jgi:hypothetical protein
VARRDAIKQDAFTAQRDRHVMIENTVRNGGRQLSPTSGSSARWFATTIAPSFLEHLRTSNVIEVRVGQHDVSNGNVEAAPDLFLAVLKLSVSRAKSTACAAPGG